MENKSFWQKIKDIFVWENDIENDLYADAFEKFARREQDIVAVIAIAVILLVATMLYAVYVNFK
jgi:hypothetical protein